MTSTGEAHMVDVSHKKQSVREATAVGTVTCSRDVVQALRDGTVPKGDVLAVARIAGIAGAKRVPDLLPLAHPIALHAATVDLSIEDHGVEIGATVRTADITGVEMEALTAVTVAALAIIDMVKGVDRSAEISGCRIIAKSGGRSGTWFRSGYEE
nr:cyclic pyranopterin monophosphate synthase MoaC [Flaviflexus huanghaiensis]